MTVDHSREIYSRSPIVEAVVDVRCVTRSDLSVRELSRAVEEAIPEATDDVQVVEVTETHTSDGTRTSTTRVIGVLRRAVDGRRVVQMQIGGMSVSRLAPYDRWESFRDEAKRVWALYCSVAAPGEITRLGVRYINRIEIGPVVEDVSSFLSVHPVTPWLLTSPPASFFLQVRQPLPDGGILVVNESTVQHVENEVNALVLDLDVYDERRLVPGEQMWNLIERLHVEVERAFEGAIKDRVRELIR